MSVPVDAAVLYYTSDMERDDAQRGTRYAEFEDGDLVSATRRGDGDAFEELVRRYRNDVFGLAHHFVRNREEAWDISQEVFLKVHRSLGRFRGDSSFKTWIMRITANQCKDFFKKRRLKTVAFDEAIGTADAPSSIPAPGRALEATEIGDAIAAALESLTAKHRTAFVLREFEGLSYDDMARIMGCRVGTVMSRLHHARKKLQRSLARMGMAEGMKT